MDFLSWIHNITLIASGRKIRVWGLQEKQACENEKQGKGRQMIERGRRDGEERKGGKDLEK